MEFRLLGPVEVRSAAGLVDAGPPRQRSVLAALAVDAGRPVLLETLIDRVWDLSPPDRARHVLYAYIARIRRVLDGDGSPTPARLVRRSGGYQLEVAADRVDALRFRGLVARAREPGRPDAERAELLGQALDLWRGTPLGDLPGEWAARVREGWHLARVEAATAWAQAQLRLGDPAASIGPLTQLVAEYPLVEPLVGMLMRALDAAGRSAEALDRYVAVRRLLVEQLGTDPGAELQAIHQSILRSPPPSRAPAPSLLPLDITGFTGRAGALAQLDRAAADAHARSIGAITLLSGTAGVGKTALAVHWAHGAAARFADGWLYVNLRGFDPVGAVMAPAEAVRTLLDALGESAARIPAGFPAQVARYRELLAGRQTLLVLDNARDADQVRPLLPGVQGCLVVVTSRGQLTGLVAAEGARPVEVGLLPVDEAQELLALRIGADRVAAEPDAATEIIARCARLPLALTIVAARAATNPDFPLHTLAAELGEGLDALDGGEAASDVRSVLSWSYQPLTPPAARLFRLLGTHPGGDITPSAAASLAALGIGDARRMLTELTRARLLIEQRAGRYQFHDLLRAYAAELTATTDPEPDRRAAQRRLYDHYLHTAYAAALHMDRKRAPIDMDSPDSLAIHDPPANPGAALEWFRAERATLLAIADQMEAAGYDVDLWRLSWTMAVHLDRDGHFADHARLHQAGLAAAIRLDDAAMQIFSHRVLGRTYGKLGRPDLGEEHFRLALARCRDIGDVLGQANILRGLAWMAAPHHGLATALELARQALALFETASDRRGQANVLNMIGWYQAEMGELAEAMAAVKLSMERQPEFDDPHDESAVLDTLGMIQQRMGLPAEAVESLGRAAMLMRPAGDRWELANVLARLAEVHDEVHDAAAAKAARVAALTIMEALDHPEAKAIRALLEDEPTAPAAAEGD